MSDFLVKRAAKKLDDFWPKMLEAYFSEFPEEKELGIPLQDVDPDPNAEPLPPLTEEEQGKLHDAIASRTNVSRTVEGVKTRLTNRDFSATPPLVQQRLREDKKAEGRSRLLRWIAGC